MRKFTDKELELAPQVAGVMGIRAERGRHVLFESGTRPYLISWVSGVGERRKKTIWPYIIFLDGDKRSKLAWKAGFGEIKSIIPLEHDCLEWLREREGLLLWKDNRKKGWIWHVRCEGELYHGGTLLEATYRCIISVGANA